MKIEHKTEKIKLIKTRLSSRKILTLSHLSNPCLSSFFQSCNTYARKPTQINTKYLISYLTFPIHPVISLSSRVMAGTRALEAESPFPVPLRLAVRLWRDTAIPWNSVSSSVKWGCKSMIHFLESWGQMSFRIQDFLRIFILERWHSAYANVIQQPPAGGGPTATPSNRTHS